jgi:outer membrane protein TolC
LPLDQARAAARANNLDLQVALTNPLIARQSVGIEEGRFEATFAPAVSLTNYRPSPETAVTFPLPPNAAVIEMFQPAVNLPLYIGGQLSAGEQIIRTNNLLPGAVPIYDTRMFLSLTQPLLRNAGVGVTTAPIQIARLQTRTNEADTKLAAIRVLADVERAYWALVGARLEMEVRRQQVKLAIGQFTNSERLVEAGVVSIADTSRAEYGLEQRREAVVVAETSLRLRERSLKRIMLRPDLPVDSTRSILPMSIPNPERLSLDRDKLVEQAVNNRMELFRLEVELAAEAIQVAVARSGRLPRVDLSARYSALGAGSTLNQALEQQFDLNYQEWIVGLQGELPLCGNQTARARLQQAQLRQLQTVIAQERLRVLIVQEVYDAVDQVELGWERIVAASRASTAAHRAYEAEVKQFERGLRTSTDVLIAAGFQADSQSSYISALVEYQNAKVALAVATGTMLGYGRVSWAEIPLHGGHEGIRP